MLENHLFHSTIKASQCPFPATDFSTAAVKDVVSAIIKSTIKHLQIMMENLENFRSLPLQASQSC